MAYRRRQGITRASTFKEEIRYPPDDSFSSTSSSPSPSLAAQAIRASAAHRDSSLSSAYGNPTFYTSLDHSTSKGSACYEDASMKTDTKSGFWGILARKAKSILEEDDMSEQFESRSRMSTQALDTSTIGQSYPAYQSTESYRRIDNPRLKKGLDALTSSLNHIGDTFEKAFEEGRTIVENKTTDIIQETRKLQFRRKGNNLEAQNQSSGISTSWQHPAQYVQPKMQTNQETQLKASRDVAMATAAKAKLLIRELKTVKADLAFAKERCSQLEEENKILRERRVKGDNPADDDLIRLQLETLLAEKARLAHENSIYARENRFLREIIEYHQLTMQDVVYLDEGIEEVTEVYPISIPLDSTELLESPTSPHLNGVPSENIPSVTLTGIEEVDLPPSPSISVPLVSTERSECSVSPQFHGSSNKNVVNEEINMASISSPKDTDNSDDEIPLDTNVSASSVHDIQKSSISS